MSEREEWLAQLKRATNFGPTNLTHYLVQMGVSDPHTCDCEEDDKRSSYWLHMDHRGWNRDVLAVIAPHRVAIRRVLNRDLNVIAQRYGDTTCGKIAVHQYEDDLLDHFLSAKPDWV
ncbi:MAG: hypothetical protein COV10_02315 [Candidatus Vogelbacteria bacterium CG10_big_fil_rev_8_21_14_0_10_51_16]|uniref:PH domain-containing protein n=1 Tax=Candidatus Vogelbacteria bacterium CG10_big_fil_rev_8_21_14_0_10_51_16 TaxID=1975045 RepID=A0A2H0REJ5_9BACT|nr:MAG: hypothetical protein COV10_02315 [Candidatus Vogelbacteria bacterium CG10_big_fil_rev_8_21_14_0_10_51_16]